MERGDLESRERGAHPERQQQDRRKEVPDIGPVNGDPAEPKHAQAGDHERGRSHALGADPVEDLRRQGDAGNHTEPEGRIPEARLERRVVQHLLQVERQQEEHAELPAGHHGGRQVR